MLCQLAVGRVTFDQLLCVRCNIPMKAAAIQKRLLVLDSKGLFSSVSPSWLLAYTGLSQNLIKSISDI